MHLAKRSSLLYRILTSIWAVVIFILSTMPGQQLPRIEWLMTPDKLAHAFVYGILAIGCYQSLENVGQKAIFAGLLASSYGIAMELIQYGFFPGRYFELWDIVANISGAFIALLIWNYFTNTIYH